MIRQKQIALHLKSYCGIDNTTCHVFDFYSLFLGKKPITSRMNWCDVKVSDYPIPVPIKFFNCLLATGSSTPDILNLPGLSIDPEWDSMFPIRPGFSRLNPKS